MKRFDQLLKLPHAHRAVIRIGAVASLRGKIHHGIISPIILCADILIRDCKIHDGKKMNICYTQLRNIVDKRTHALRRPNAAFERTVFSRALCVEVGIGREIAYMYFPDDGRFRLECVIRPTIGIGAPHVKDHSALRICIGR